MDLEQEIERIAKAFGDETCPTLEDWEKSLKNKLREMAAFTRKQTLEESARWCLDNATGEDCNVGCHEADAATLRGAISLQSGECGFCKRKRLAAAPLSATTPDEIELEGGPRVIAKGTATLKAEVASSPSPTGYQVERERAEFLAYSSRASLPTPLHFHLRLDGTHAPCDCKKSSEWVKVTPELSYEDLCRLAQVFMGNCELRCHVTPHGPMDARIHDWLSEKLTNARPLPSPPKENRNE